MQAAEKDAGFAIDAATLEAYRQVLHSARCSLACVIIDSPGKCMLICSLWQNMASAMCQWTPSLCTRT